MVSDGGRWYNIFSSVTFRDIKCANKITIVAKPAECPFKIRPIPDLMTTKSSTMTRCLMTHMLTKHHHPAASRRRPSSGTKLPNQSTKLR